MKKIFQTKSATPLKINEDEKVKSIKLILLTFFIPLILVISLLFMLVSYRGGIEAGIARLALWLPVGYAFGAGMVASANPCGILMLPSYVLFQLRTDEPEQNTIQRRFVKSLQLSLIITIGFILVFGLVGYGIAQGGQWLLNSFPIIGLIIGILMALLGLWILLANKTIAFLSPETFRISPQRNLWNAFLFGVLYALGSLSCTLPIFLAVIGTSFTGNLESGFIQFLAYALGMGIIIVVVMVGTALFRRAIARWMRTITPYIHRLSAFFLVGAGGYLIYYWIFVSGL